MQFKLHDSDSVHSLRHFPSWLLLSAAAGIVNGFAFVTCQRFASHLTGNVSQVGMGWINSVIIIESATIIGAFLVGSIAAIALIKLPIYRGAKSAWASPLLVVAAMLAVVAGVGYVGGFGTVKDTVDTQRPLILLSVLSFAMGIQNAAVAVTTGLAVRTTHLTGPITDLGIHLGTSLVTTGEDRRNALKAAALRFGKVLAFVVGVALSLPLSTVLEYFTLLIPAAFVLSATYLSFIPSWSAFQISPVDDAPNQAVPEHQLATAGNTSSV